MSGRAVSLFAAVVLLGVQVAAAYNIEMVNGQKVKFAKNEAELVVNVDSIDDEEMFSAIDQGIVAFNLNPSRFRYKRRYDETILPEMLSGGVNGNGKSEIIGADLDSERWIVKAFRSVDGSGKIAECDVVINFSENVAFDLSGDARGIIDFYPLGFGGDYSFQELFLKELGRCAGLNDETRYYSSMMYAHLQRYGYGTRAYLGEDSASGLVNLYGISNKKRLQLVDIGVAGWKHSNPGGSGVIQPVGVYGTDGVLMPVNYDFELALHRYQIRAGTDVLVEATLENNGRNRQRSVKVGYYLSDSFDGTRAYELGRATVSLVRDAPDQTLSQVSIPRDVPPGTYLVFVVVDPDRRIREADESNNVMHIVVDVVR